MIRDPSDGSVREKPEKGISLPASDINSLPPKTASEGITAPVLETATSGLQTGSTKPEYQARLEKSRKWLADYHAGTPQTAIADGESD